MGTGFMALSALERIARVEGATMSVVLLVDREERCLRWSSGECVEEDKLHELGFRIGEQRVTPPIELLEDTSYEVVIDMDGLPSFVIDFRSMTRIQVDQGSIKDVSAS
jgi:hypothetical protein